MADNIENNDVNKENASIDVSDLSTDNHLTEIDYTEAVNLLLNYYSNEHFALMPWFSITDTNIRKICYLLVFHTHNGEFCECYPPPRDNMLAACNILSSIAFNMNDILYNDNVVAYLVNSRNKTASAFDTKFDHSGIRNAMMNPKFGSQIEDFYVASNFHCYITWKDTEVSFGRLFFAYIIWLKFLIQNYTQLYKRYVNYLLLTDQLERYGIFVQITTIANIFFLHEESIDFWRYSFTYTVVPTEVQYFLNECYGFLPNVLTILQSRLFGDDNFRIFRSLSDNKSYFDATLLDGNAIIPERLGRCDWWRSPNNTFRNLSSITTTEPFMSIKDSWEEYNRRRKEKDAKKERQLERQRRGVVESSEKTVSTAKNHFIRF